MQSALKSTKILEQTAAERRKVLSCREASCLKLTLHLLTYGFSQRFRLLAALSVHLGYAVGGKLSRRHVIRYRGGDNRKLLFDFGADDLSNLLDAITGTRVDELIQHSRDLVGCLPTLFHQIGAKLTTGLR